MGNLTIPSGTHAQVGDTVTGERWESQREQATWAGWGKNILIRLQERLLPSLTVALVSVATWFNNCEATNDLIPQASS